MLKTASDLTTSITIEPSMHDFRLSEGQREKLIRFSQALIDQHRARMIVPPMRSEQGYWFGGGNMIEVDGTLFVVGRYRDAGDSRTGLTAGKRGWELAIFRSHDRGATFEKIVALAKSDLSLPGKNVLSIEGSAIRATENGFELYVSTEKDGIGYPPGFEHFLKPGTGVWSIDRLEALTIEELQHARPQPMIASEDPACLHVKDPFLRRSLQAESSLGFCHHPYCWTSSNTGFASPEGELQFEYFPRGTTWDVAISRGTCSLDLPDIRWFENDEPISLLFYDGGECVRNHDEHKAAVARPRGSSCEELGGVAAISTANGQVQFDRLSDLAPMFVSPYGTGCSRYVDVLRTSDGYFATWQQSQPDGSQPLVMNFLSTTDAQALLR